MKRIVGLLMMVLFSVSLFGCATKNNSFNTMPRVSKTPAMTTEKTPTEAITQDPATPPELMLTTLKEKVSAGANHTVGLKADGTVVAVGLNMYGQCDVSGWSDIISVSGGYFHTVGLKTDGTVVATGSDNNDLSYWSNIVAVSAGGYHTVGLKADGTVVAAGENKYGQCDVFDWSDIVAVSAGDEHTVGLKADGTIAAVGKNNDGQCNISKGNIVAVSAGDSHTVCLKTDGTVIAAGWNDWGQCEVFDWSDIVAVSAGSYHTVGLKADGTAVMAGKHYNGPSDLSDWNDIVAVSAGTSHTVGLKADGTVVAAGSNSDGQCNVSDWGSGQSNVNNDYTPSNDAVNDNNEKADWTHWDITDWDDVVWNDLQDVTGMQKGVRIDDDPSRLNVYVHDVDQNSDIAGIITEICLILSKAPYMVEFNELCVLLKDSTLFPVCQFNTNDYSSGIFYDLRPNSPVTTQINSLDDLQDVRIDWSQQW